MAEKVLVVDDDQDIRFLLGEYMGNLKGFTVLLACDGQEGLEMALAEKPDLMIVDNQMPKLSGTQMLRKLRENDVSIPAIMTTAYGSEATAVEAFRLGVRDYIIKPFGFEDINAAVERALRESRLQRERDQLLQQVMDANEQLARRLHELRTLHEIGQSVASSLDPEDVLHQVVDAAVQITDAEEGFLMLLDEAQGELYVRASKNLDSETQSLRLPVDDSLAGQVITTKEPLLVGEDDRWQKIKTSYLVRSLVYIPLIVQNQAIGVLSVVNRVREIHFDQRDFRVLATLADYAALALHNAQLYTASNDERTKLSTIISQTDDPILVVDDCGRLVVINDAARVTFRLFEDEADGRPAAEVIKNPKALEFLSQQVGSGLSPRGEIAMADGRTFNASMSIIAGVGRSMVMQDITQLKELDRLKSEFVSVVSHDLRSPLTSILGYVQLLERAGDLNETQREFVSRVHNSVTNITELINDLLDLGRLEAGLDLTLTDCSMNDIIEDVVNEAQPNLDQKHLNLQLDLTCDPPMILGDRKRLQQALGNLVNNAIKYTPKGGEIRIHSRAQDGQVITQVTDTGVGISPSDQPFVFDKFFRADDVAEEFEGTGLGLSIVKSVVETHNGRIWVESTPYKGTTFTLVLPSAMNGRHPEHSVSTTPA